MEDKNRNDGMEELEKVFIAGLLDAIFNTDGDEDSKTPIFTNPKDSQTKECYISLAESAKEIQAAYKMVGFTDQEAFELLKITLTEAIK